LNQKRPVIGKKKCKVILLHNNARSYVAKVIKNTLSALQWEVLPYAAYSTDYAPSDHHILIDVAWPC